jgi:predicted DNA-binding protein YlxM (UPF0122 family)
VTSKTLSALRWPNRLTSKQTQSALRKLAAAGWSVAEIAAACGVTREAVYQWRSGVHCGPAMLAKLVKTPNPQE